MEKMNGGYEFSNGTKVKVLAYADDICVIGKSKDEIEKMLETIYKYTQWAGLHFNPVKCGCLSMINHNTRKYVDKSQVSAPPRAGPATIPEVGRKIQVSRCTEGKNSREMPKGAS